MAQGQSHQDRATVDPPGAFRLEEKDFASQHEALLAFVESISSELALRPLLDRLLQHACELIGADGGTIGLVDSTRELIRVESAIGMGTSVVGAEYVRGVGLAGHVLEMDDVVTLPRYSDLPAPVSDREDAVVGLPIRWQGQMIGFFGIGRAPGSGGEPATPFSDDDVRTLGVFARHAAIAIENARRYLKEQEHGERMALIAKIGTLITADFRPDEMLQDAAEAIHDLLGYANIGIGVLREGDPPTLVIEGMAGEFNRVVPRPCVLPIGKGVMGACARERRAIRVDEVHNDPRYVPAPGIEGIKCLLALPILVGDELLGVLNVESDDAFDDDDEWGLQIVADQLAVAMHNVQLYEQAQEGAAFAERQRIARDLHDSVTQQLFGTVMLAESLGNVWERDPEQGKRRAARVLELSRAALGEMRALLAELRPSLRFGKNQTDAAFGAQRIRAYGLPEAIGRLASEVRDRGLPVEVSTVEYEPCPFILEEALYRITQEALNNSAKHAQATGASVNLTSDSSGVRLVIEDDGRGMDPEGDSGQRHNGRGIGLTSMSERAAAVGGEFAMATALGSGVRVEVFVPKAAQAELSGE